MTTRIAVLTFLAFVVAGCGQSVTSNVQTFRTIEPNELAGSRIVVVSPDEVKAQTLEFGAQKAQLEDKLRSIGLQVVTEQQGMANGVDYVLFFNYTIGEGREQAYSYSIPTYGQTEVASSYTTGSVNSYGNYSGTTSHTPTYGVTGSTTHVGSNTIYDRIALIDIWKIKLAADPEKVYESKIKSTGSTGEVTQVLDEMLAALFKDFWRTGNRSEDVKAN